MREIIELFLFVISIMIVVHIWFRAIGNKDKKKKR